MASTDQSKLMNNIGLSDSLDSSSDDIIPMQRRKRQRSYSKRRNLRSSPTSSIFLKSNYTYGVCALVKFIFFTFVIGALILSLALSYNLYNRLDFLQLSLDGLQSTKSNLPEEMHLIHSQLKILDKNSTQLKTELNIALDLATNMTNDIAQIQFKLQKISESIEAAPTIAQLPKDVEDLKKIVADLGSKMASDDKEVKLAREQQVSQDGRLISLESKWKTIDDNISQVTNLTESTSKLSETVANLQSDTARFMANMTSLKSLLDETTKSQQRLDEWRLLIQDKVDSINATTTAASSVPLGQNISKLLHVKKVLSPADIQISNTTANPDLPPKM